jgi:hypothetical protein
MEHLLDRLERLRPEAFPHQAASWGPDEVDRLISLADGSEWRGVAETAAFALHGLERVVGELTRYPMPNPPLDPKRLPESFLEYQDYYADTHRWLRMIADGSDTPGDAQWGTGKLTP